MSDKPDWRNRRCGDGWQSDGGDCRLPLGHAGAHESNKPDWVAEARALCDAATPGPWMVPNGGINLRGKQISWNVTTDAPNGERIGAAGCSNPEDAAFIASARTALPRALTALEAADVLAELADRLVRATAEAEPEHASWIPSLRGAITLALAKFKEARR